MGATAADKMWNEHVVRHNDDGTDLIYIDFHLLHEANTPPAFDGLRERGRTVRHPELTLGTEDHIVPTTNILSDISRTPAALQVSRIRRNCEEFGIELYSLGNESRGIVHVIGPELGISQPGMTVVCCDSHTTTNGALGALAFGIGTSQVEHVLATQTLPMRKMKNLRVTIDGELAEGVTAKDVALAMIRKIGTGGGQGQVIEYQGSTIRNMSVEGRMTLCNMSIEAGARAGIVAADEVTFEYLRDRKFVPKGTDFNAEVEYWKTFTTDEDAIFDKEVHIDASKLAPHATWGTKPSQVVTLADEVPDPLTILDEAERASAERALQYMDLRPGTRMKDIEINSVFIGSCTNGRIEDLRTVAEVWKNKKVSPEVQVYLVPGSDSVRRQAVDEGLDRVFEDAGVEFRYSGCSMCVGLNTDRLGQGDRSASTNNRNFEGRQGPGARTHVVSPRVAAASAVLGRLAEPKDLEV